MSVVFTPRARAPRWKSLWPLALFLTLTVVGGIWLWLAWPQVLLQSAVWQRSLNLELSQLLQAVADNPSAAGLSLLGFSFVYGVLHALGPGHGKIVITTACHPSLKAEIEYCADAGGIAVAGNGGDSAGGGGIDAAAASGASTASQQLLAGEGELSAGRRIGAFTVLAGIEKTASLAAAANVYRFYPASRP